MKLDELFEDETGTRRIIYNIARRIRRWAEQKAKQIKMSPDLEGLCDMASRKIYAELRSLGLNPKIHQAPPGLYSHFYVEVEGYLVDVTASQFGGPKIAIRRMDNVDSKKNWHWRRHKEYTDVDPEDSQFWRD